MFWQCFFAGAAFQIAAKPAEAINLKHESRLGGNSDMKLKPTSCNPSRQLLQMQSWMISRPMLGLGLGFEEGMFNLEDKWFI